jgi:hypothetical protein
MTVAHYLGGACPLWHSEGDVFYRNSGYYLCKRIVGVNPLPRGASVGELGKNLSPSKRRICWIHEYIREYASRREFCFVARKCSQSCSVNFTWFVDLLTSCEIIKLALDRKSDVYFRQLEYGKLKNSWTREMREARGISVQKFRRVVIFMNKVSKVDGRPS